MVNFGPLTAEICWRVWGTPANFNGFRVFAALLHGTLVVGVSQTLRRWTEGATYIRQGDHHVGHWPTFLELFYFTRSLISVISLYLLFVGNWDCVFCINFSRYNKNQYKHSLTFRVPRYVVTHSNETSASIANPPNSALLEATLYHSPNLHPAPHSNLGMRRGTHRQTDPQTAVTTIHFASAAPHAKCNYNILLFCCSFYRQTCVLITGRVKVDPG